MFRRACLLLKATSQGNLFVMISVLTNDNFDSTVTQAPGVHAVRFSAEWCGPCRTMAPVFKDVAKELSPTVQFAELNIDHAPELAARFGVQSIPTVLLFKDGKVVDQLVGVAGKPAVIQFINRQLS